MPRPRHQPEISTLFDQINLATRGARKSLSTATEFFNKIDPQRPRPSPKTGRQFRRKRSPSALRSVRKNRDHLDRYEQIGHFPPKPANSARGRFGRIEPRVFLIQRREISWPRQKHVNIDDILPGCACSLENILAVLKRLPCLVLNGCASKLIGVRIDTTNS